MPGKNSTPQPPEASSSSPTGRLHDQDPPGYVNHFNVMAAPQNSGIARPANLLQFHGLPAIPVLKCIWRFMLRCRWWDKIPSQFRLWTSYLHHLYKSKVINIGTKYSSTFDWWNLKLFRSSKKRHCSSSRHSPGILEPVAEEHSWLTPNFKLARLSDDVLAPETGNRSRAFSLTAVCSNFSFFLVEKFPSLPCRKSIGNWTNSNSKTY